MAGAESRGTALAVIPGEPEAHAAALGLTAPRAAFGTPRLGGDKHMLWALIVILFVLWLVFLIGKFVVGGLIHLLLVAAVILLIVKLLTGRTTPAV